MRHIFSNGIAMAVAVALLAGAAGAAGPPGGPLSRCAADAVVSGAGCMDKYEASVWRVPNPTTLNKFLVGRIRGGKATAADLAAGGAKQLGVFTTNDYPPCGANGNCADVFAVSIPGVLPSANITWFQAEEACANSGKRLPTSAEWQVAAHGSPDPGPDNGTTDCNTVSNVPTLTTPTGSRSGCVSTRGAFDMVGNVAEWVADWVPQSTNCVGWGNFSNDDMCLAGASTTATAPGALVRGGAFAVLAAPLPARSRSVTCRRIGPRRVIGFAAHASQARHGGDPSAKSSPVAHLRRRRARLGGADRPTRIWNTGRA